VTGALVAAGGSSLIDGLPDGVVLCSGDGTVSHVNARAAAMLGVPREKAIGAHLSEVVALQDLEGNGWHECVRPLDGLRTRTRLVERAWYTDTGAEVLVTATLQRSRPAGPVTGVAVCLRDAGQRARLDRERSELVATVAHELRSPLTGVKGFTATLLAKWERLNDSQKLLMLQTVDADADRLTRLIAELLDVARIDTGRLSVRKEPVDVGEAAARQLEPLSPPAGRQLRLEVDGVPKAWVDRDKFSQIVANLVENAVRHGSGDVWVKVRALDDGVELIVDDDGPGIPEDIRPRIFTKFWKHGRAGGSGLGLYIVRGLAEAHEGTVRVETSPSGGARVRVWLPHGQPGSIA
jgi:PAS domain S-box-containing protein